MDAAALFGAVFLACAVEAVEAATIVLAAGAARNWRSALTGTLAALATLVLVVAALGPALADLPLRGLRLVIGALLLVFGLQWLRKAILRASGHKAPHDEDEIYRKHVAALAGPSAAPLASGSAALPGAGPVPGAGPAAGGPPGEAPRHMTAPDWYGFALSFKGVLLEGLEVAFIALTLGSSARDMPLAALAAACAALAVAAAAAAARRPLSRVPENAMKFIVGVMLTAFGTFWAAEGAGGRWPGSDASLLVLAPAVAVFALALVVMLRRIPAAQTGAALPAELSARPMAGDG